MPRRLVLIANPGSGRGKVAKLLPRLRAELTAAGANYAAHMTEHAGHAIELAEQAVHDGADVIAAIGGDGTVNEIVNGMRRIPDADAAMAIVPAGSGSDFARSFQTSPGIEGAAQRLLDGETRSIDVATIHMGSDRRHFINIAEAGLGGSVVERAERLPRWLGRSRYLIAFWPTWARFSPVEVTVETDSGSYSGLCHNVIVANASYFGGGMHVAPNADPTDGALEVQLNVGPKRQAFTMIPKVYKGRHLGDERVVQLRGAHIDIAAELPLRVEADGEPLGLSPLTIDVTGHLQVIT